VHDTIRHFVHNYAKYSPIKNSVADSAIHLWFLTIPPHVKYVTTVPRNLPLITASLCDGRSFPTFNVSQGSVATHVRCGGIFNKHLAANLLENLAVKIV